MQSSANARSRFAALAAILIPLSVIAAEPVDFSRDIRPLLSDNCYQCHGPDANERVNEMRLDLADRSVGLATESGGPAIEAGSRAKSEVYRRLITEDEDLRMPPAESGKQLTKEQVELIGRWIDQGAEFRKHWSFNPPVRIKPEPIQAPKDVERAQNAIDHFIRAKLRDQGLTPSPEADKRTLIRRLTFDLTGLPPTLEEVESFLADDSDQAYERLVDRLLKSPRFGEHMAHYWLDAARYGDTHGLHLDNERSIWPYRDWVIRAFNSNMPFDRFTIEQLAGDLLPEPSVDQLVATGFNRCNVTTSEGGAIRKEFRMRYAVDRVETTATVWLGLTAGCAACHDHKFDPISQQDFYRLYAFFYSFEEDAMDGNKLLPAPVISVNDGSVDAQVEAIRNQIADLDRRIADEVAKIDYQEPTSEVADSGGPNDYVWIDDQTPAGAKLTGWSFAEKKAAPVLSGSRSTHRSQNGFSQHVAEGSTRPIAVGEGDRIFTYVFLDPKQPPKEIMLQFNVNGWNHRAFWGENLIDWGETGKGSRKPMGELPELGKWVRLEFPASEVGLKPGDRIHGWAFSQVDGAVSWDKAGLVTTTRQPGERFDSFKEWLTVEGNAKKSTLPNRINAALRKPVEERSPAEHKRLRDYFIEHVYRGSQALIEPLHAERETLRDKVKKVQQTAPKTLVMGDRKRMPTYVLKRGEYDKEDRDQRVEPGTPEVLHAFPQGAPANRLGLARWLVDKQNPLTARVTVNRFWQQMFGAGIVVTAEDFGSQGQWPSHPQLLDWLAVEFIESGWNVKHMLKLMVMSSTYRQTSRLTPEMLEKDPSNRLLARGPRFRLDAEMIRDNALACSGLLVERLGGKGVRPYQPPGLWNAVGYTSSNTANFRRDSGESLYRRSVYTFWKRTSPPPVMAIFDAPSREACVVRRSRTNTPQQALLTMNDEQFVEAARAFAQRMMLEGGEKAPQRLSFAFQVATARQPDTDELAILVEVLENHRQHFEKHPDEAKQLIQTGESKPDAKLNAAELAAYTMAANLILNLDETLTRN